MGDESKEFNVNSAAEASALRQLDALIAEHKALGQEPPHEQVMKLIASSRAAVDRIAGPDSAYAAEVTREISRGGFDQYKLSGLHGIILALAQDIRGGFIQKMAEIHHSEVFADYLEMATHLCDEGFKDAAAVIAGSSLEAHLRALTVRVSLAPVKADGNPKKADSLNAELANSGVYGKLDQKAVTAWLDLRNKAAHGHYGEYTKEQVNLMISSIQEFMLRHPA